MRCNVSIAHRISHGTNVVVVSIQSNSSEKILLFANWLFTKTTFVPWDILWAMLIWVKTRGVLPLCLSFGCFFELGMLSYLI